MLLSDLIQELRDVTVSGDVNTDISAVTSDSRRVAPGTLFCALKGAKADGSQFIDQAIERGAAAILTEGRATRTGVGWLQAANARRAMAEAAAALFANPSHHLAVAGVTGTNGKTTVAFLIHHLLRASKHRAGLIGTVRYDDGLGETAATHTTPESTDLQALLDRMLRNECYGVAMEVSSHALAQFRAHRVAFDAAIFTNLTQDHLDFHVTMEDYFKSKAILFEQICNDSSGKKPTAIVNIDDSYGRRLVQQIGERVKVVRYGLSAGANFRASNVRSESFGTSFQLEVGDRKLLVRTPLIGRFNVYNSLAALAGAQACGRNLRESVQLLADAPQVPGRMEAVAEKRNYRVFVDYAHTPDALENALRTLRELNPRRLICVFGCGGDRDKTKRPLMGRIASDHADVTVLTSDNPRSEEPAAILTDIRAGFRTDRVLVIEDRAEAISRAIHACQEGDIVLIAGKGHENHQIFADRTIAFDDRQVARRAIAAKPTQSAIARSEYRQNLPPRP